MAVTSTYMEGVLCKAKGCYSSLSYKAVKNRSYGEDEEFEDKIPLMKKLYSLIFVLENEYNSRFGDCIPCSCGGAPYKGSEDDLSCAENCLTDDQICLLNEKVNLLCDRVNSSCN